jgi:nitroreductase
MNETVNFIKNRRSLRQFKVQQISDVELQTIMECAIWAPNAMNQQKWHFSVIQNKDLIKRMIDITKENMLNSGVEFLAGRAKDPNFNPYFGAPTVIFVTAEEKARFSQVDAALASQNVLIAAASCNIGSHIMTSTDFLFASDKGKAIKKEMGIPEGYNHLCAIALGYMEGAAPEARPRNKEAITYIK